MVLENMEHKMKKDTCRIKGILAIYLNGIKVREVDNLITTAGLGFIASYFAGNTTAKVEYIAVGTGATAEEVGDTVLEAEVARKQADILLGSGADSNKIYYSVTYPPTSIIATITEAGILTAASGGTLFNRATFAGIAVGQVDALTIVWTISFA